MHIGILLNFRDIKHKALEKKSKKGKVYIFIFKIGNYVIAWYFFSTVYIRDKFY